MSDSEQVGPMEEHGGEISAAPVETAPPPQVATVKSVSDQYNHRFTVSLTDGRPMIVVRGNTAMEIIDALGEVERTGMISLVNSAMSVLRAGSAPPPPAPAPQPQAPPQAAPQAPAWQQAGPPQAQAWQQARPPQAQAPAQWGGGGRSQPARNAPKPRPSWPQVYKISVPMSNKEEFRAYREQYKNEFRGKVSWAGGGDYWVSGDIVQAFANYNPVPA